MSSHHRSNPAISSVPENRDDWPGCHSIMGKHSDEPVDSRDAFVFEGVRPGGGKEFQVAAKVHQLGALFPVVGKNFPACCQSGLNQVVVARVGVAEKVSDVHVRASRMGILPVENSADLPIVNQNVGGVEIPVDEATFGVDLPASWCLFVPNL